MVNVTDYITSPYELRIPWDSFLLKYQLRYNFFFKGKSEENKDNELAEEDELKYIETEDAGTFTWCLRNCKRICETSENLSSVSLMNQILTLLKEDNSEIIASVLCDTLGFNNLNFISKLITFRQNLTRQWQSMLDKLCTKIRYNKLDDANYERLNRAVIQKTGKDLRSQKKRLEILLSQIPPQDLFCLIGLDFKSEKKLNAITFPKQLSLNLIKEDNEIYEKLIIPPSENRIVPSEDELIPISTLPEWAQKAFVGIEKLNLIQSKVFNSAFNTQQNLLISAPTGCGKTNVGLLCLLQNYREYFEQGKKCGKVIYISPMKALASEIVEKYSKALTGSGLVVREVTGDFQVPKSELEEIDILVTTPEKCDVVTRNSFSTATQSDDSFLTRVNLIIFDEIHLLNDERGPVIESIAARFFRLIEWTQVTRRVVGMSATLPNYEDIAAFLRVPPEHTYYFGREYRHVPLQQIFYGIKNDDIYKNNMLTICFDHIVETLESGKQCMVFVHSRNETFTTASRIVEMINRSEKSDLFQPDLAQVKRFSSQLMRRNNLKLLSDYSISIHHAGLSKSDRDLVEEMFKSGLVKVLVCTSTLAWGVNLPAHSVIIKGTFIGGVGVDRNINNLELNQIMGRAGRPQFDVEGKGILLTDHKNLYSYVRMQTERVPIESQLHVHLENFLNAEIAIGSINNDTDALLWLQYTYLFVRMVKNPLFYGINGDDEDTLLKYRHEIIKNAAKNLNKSKLIRYSSKTGDFSSTDLGRIAARYYVDYETTHNFASSINPLLYYQDGIMMDRYANSRADLINHEFILDKLSECREFESILYRNEEYDELLDLMNSPLVIYKPKGGINHIKNKVSVLIQAYIAKLFIKTSSLVTDLNFIVQNIPRLARAYFEISMCETVCGPPVEHIHDWVLILERQIFNSNVLSNFTSPMNNLTPSKDLGLLSTNLVDRFNRFKLEDIINFSYQEVLDIVRSKQDASTISKYIKYIPYPEVKLYNQPITDKITKLTVSVEIKNDWSRRWNGSNESFYVWVCTSSRLLSQSQVSFTSKGVQFVEFFVPIHNRNEPFCVKIFSSNWLGLSFEISTKLQAPGEGFNSADKYTPLLKLNPLPTSVLKQYNVYNFPYFNPLQTQVFHKAFMTDESLVVAAPTGSGKTLVAELGLFRLFDKFPGKIAVYIAPLKALAHERFKDWCKKLHFKNILQLTGDTSSNNLDGQVHSERDELEKYDIVITTPEKWDGISRHWRRRKLVTKVGLVIIDELHLLGESRGAIIESIISRQYTINHSTGVELRYICLSTSLSNLNEIAEWMNIPNVYNFSPAVRPVKCNLFIDGFSIKAYCPRMNSMNKPCFDTIIRHDHSSNVLIFVSSRRQTRMTAQDLVGLLQFYNISFSNTNDTYFFDDEWLNTFVPNGIGIHHAGLSTKDRELVQDLFLNGKLKVLIATSTLAWGVNLPAKIVIIKGTEFYDGRVKRYIDYSATDIIQMVGRAGRNIYDGEAYAYVFTETRKVGFYKAFMFTPFPTESFFLEKINDCLNSEIATGSVTTKKGALDYLSRTFLYKRLKSNPKYYTQSPNPLYEDKGDVINDGNNSLNFVKLSGVDGTKLEDICEAIVNNAISSLVKLGCVSLEYPEDELKIIEHGLLVPTLNGIFASQYYVNCKTVHEFSSIDFSENLGFYEIARILSNATEFNLVPLRHNEDVYNVQLSNLCPSKITESEASDPNAKTFLLFQARLFNLKLPVFDYNNDTKSILDQLPRIIQCLLDIFIINRNFKNVEYLLLLYKCLHLGLNPLNLQLVFEVNYEISVKVNGISKPKGGKYTVSSDVVNLTVMLDEMNQTNEFHYLFLVNHSTNVIYGYKKVYKQSLHTFKLRIDKAGNLTLLLILSCPTLLSYDQQIILNINKST
ncbi:Sec63 Brl domain protein [Theileria parva strain Muguga]|uniref:Sec63 Brl domain protein n=1 Tax=Theileria parva strain Muguga TaxID=333668 RepID=UPI001C61E3DA|nr:Sec63 Brl domain protein [Theileria parva strain Muguga]KAF5153407.1 Sec63 Brl domain protein [Theileria parva strain Muguga]